MAFDFCITDYGELVYNELGNDIKAVELDELIRQKAICRIKSVTKDWFNAPNIGADIEYYLGSPNNESTCDLIIDNIKNNLTFDGLLNKNDLFFVPKIDKNKLSIIVFIKGKSTTKPTMINIEIDIVMGVNVRNDTNPQ